MSHIHPVKLFLSNLIASSARGSRAPIFDKKSSLLPLMLSSVIILSACGGGGGADDGRIVGADGIARLQIPEADKVVRSDDLAYAYLDNGPYKSILKDCATRIFNDCLLSELPMIYQDVKTPTVSDIMNRVLVTHDWMGLRFQQLIEQLPQESLKVFAPVTHIIVGGDTTRVTAYNAYGNVLRVGPRALWLTEEEKLAVNTDTGESGSGSDDEDEFLFDFRWRFMKDDNYALWTESLDTREYDRLVGRFQTSLFYSLAFANNVSYPAVIDNLPTNITTVEVFEDYYGGFADDLYSQPGVFSGSSILYQLNEAYYEDDVSPTALQSSYLPDYVGSLFADDGMPVFFSYEGTSPEMSRLLQLGMLKYFSDIYIDVAFTNPEPAFEVLGCDDAKIAWGVRNRLANPAVAIKSKFLMEQVFGQSAKLDNFFANDVGEELPLPVDAGWCDSIRLMSGS